MIAWDGLIMVTFLHAADLHIDSPMLMLGRYEGAPVEEVRQATRTAVVNLVDLAMKRRVDLVLLAGDVFDGPWNDFATGLFFVKHLARLADHKIPVVLINGNHDAANKMRRSLRWPTNVTMLSVDAPETIRFEHIGISVHGQGFARQSVTEDLSLGYPEADRGEFNIGLLHTAAEGRPGHEPYAPCSIEGLKLKGYDYWALGHVHGREIISEEPWIVFPGNTQGRHVNETGAKGCCLVTVDSTGSSQVEFVELDAVRWHRERLKAEGDSADSALASIETSIKSLLARLDRPGIFRFEIELDSSLYQRMIADEEHWLHEIRAMCLHGAPAPVMVQDVHWRPRTTKHRAKIEGPVGFLAEFIQNLQRNPDERKRWEGRFAYFLRKLPPELRQSSAESLGLGEWIGELLPDVEPFLLHRLGGSSE